MASSEKAGSGDTRRLAERQARRWEIQHREGGTPRRAPCVALSRLPGAGGTEVGQHVARWLDYGFFGHEIVDQISEELGVDHWLVEGLDERVRSAIDVWSSEVFRTNVFNESDYLRQVTKIIATLGRRGNAVIVGRGAPYILPRDEALRVLVVAPRAARVERYGHVKSLTEERAEEALTQAEKRRGEFARRQFRVRQDDPEIYDLVINTERLSYEAAATLVVEALRQRFPT